MFQVDGEGLRFKEFVKIDVEPEAIEVVVDFAHIMEQTQMLAPQTL